MNTVSVIIPVYKVEEYLSECLESIIRQSYKDIEIILIDDGSPDCSGGICDQFAVTDKRITVYHRPNEGVSKTRNFGIEKAKGDWLFFVDSDDWLHEKTIELAMNHVRDTTDICFIGHKEVFNKGDSTQYPPDSPVRIVDIGSDDFRGLQFRILNRDREAVCDRNIIKLSSPWKIYKKDLILKNNIRFPEDLVNGEDGVFNLYAYRYAHEGIAIEEHLYYYRQRLDSVTKKYTPDVENDFRSLHKAYRRFIREEKNPSVFREVYYERLIWSLGFCCMLNYCHKDNPKKYSDRRKDFLDAFSNEYEKGIYKADLKSFNLQKKVLFWAIRKKAFLMVSLLCMLNDRKNKEK